MAGGDAGDKATRTVAMLTERLDQHRGRGQQQIIVKHVTVNADQAVVTDTVVTGKLAGNAVSSPHLLLADAPENPMPMDVETNQRDLAVGGWQGWEKEMTVNPMHKAHGAPRCTAKSKRTGQPCRAPAVARLAGMPERAGAPEGKRNGNYRHGARTKETIALWKLIKSLS